MTYVSRERTALTLSNVRRMDFVTATAVVFTANSLIKASGNLYTFRQPHRTIIHPFSKAVLNILNSKNTIDEHYIRFNQTYRSTFFLLVKGKKTSKLPETLS